MNPGDKVLVFGQYKGTVKKPPSKAYILEGHVFVGWTIGKANYVAVVHPINLKLIEAAKT